VSMFAIAEFTALATLIPEDWAIISPWIRWQVRQHLPLDLDGGERSLLYLNVIDL